MNLKRRVSGLERSERLHAPRSLGRVSREAEDLSRGAGMTYETACQSVLAAVSDSELDGLIAEAEAPNRNARRSARRRSS